MTQFHKGQEVEVTKGFDGNPLGWRKAKIIKRGEPYSKTWMVEFPDGTRAMFDAEHIRAVVHLPQDAKAGDTVIVEGPCVVKK